MEIEYEAKFLNIDKAAMRGRLQFAGGKIVKEEFLQKRVNFDLPGDKNKQHHWLRVRNEGDKITLSYKTVGNEKVITDVKEVLVEVSDFDKSCELLELMGCVRKAYQENKREVWSLNGADIFLDEWPFLEPFMEVEGTSEENVKQVCEQLALDYNEAIFGSISKLYVSKYKIPEEYINNHIPKIVFDMDKNPFLEAVS